jgi:hypothetical protein
MLKEISSGKYKNFKKNINYFSFLKSLSHIIQTCKKWKAKAASLLPLPIYFPKTKK